MPAAILRQQGIHPHPGPRGRGLVSMLDVEYWDQCGWTTPEAMALCHLNTGSMPCERPRHEWWDVIPDVLPQRDTVEACDLTRPDDDEVEGYDQAETNDGFSDWYGYPSSQEHLCRGRRESVLGTAWIDEEAYLRPPLSRLQAALCCHGERSMEDPSSKKLLRWQLENRQEGVSELATWEDELHSTWVD